MNKNFCDKENSETFKIHTLRFKHTLKMMNDKLLQKKIEKYGLESEMQEDIEKLRETSNCISNLILNPKEDSNKSSNHHTEFVLNTALEYLPDGDS